MTGKVEEDHHRRYRVFLIVEGALLFITVLMCAGLLTLQPRPPKWLAMIAIVPFVVLGMWHVVAIPISIFCLNVPDDFQVEQPELIAVLTEKLTPFLGAPA